MKEVYPVIFTHADGYFVADIVDFQINTQGISFADAIMMSRDAIGLMGIDMEDDGEDLPKPSSADLLSIEPGDILAYVDVDFADYRRRHDMKTVRRNVSLPCWLDSAAERAGINVSAVLQKALKAELNLADI